MRRSLTVLAFATVVASIGSLTAAASAVNGAKATPAAAPGLGAAATYKNPPNPICSIARPAGATDYPIDCEAGVGIHNEEAIAVDPTDPAHWVASANDYQLKVSSGGQVAAYVFSRAKVTFDAGATWTTYPVPFNGYTGTGDPSIAFDDEGNVYFTTLGAAGFNLPDVLVAHSTDGGRHWTRVRIAAGKGSHGTSVFPDHPVLTARGAGNLIGQAYDGSNEGDFPVSIDGRQTLQDSEFRLLMQGNITADPTDPTGRHFAVVWFDDRNAAAPLPADPYAAVTNSDVIVSQTWDGGATWSPPAAITLPRDQFMPWAAYDGDGRLRVGFFDRSYDPANHQYGFTVASETSPGSLTFTEAQATTALSDPTQGNAWFRTTVDQNFPNATRFVGDYSGV